MSMEKITKISTISFLRYIFIHIIRHKSIHKTSSTQEASKKEHKNLYAKERK